MATLRVETRREPGGRRAPVRFGFGDATREVVEVEDRWPGEGHEYFRLRCDDAAVYILRHEVEGDRWELVFLEERGASGGAPGRPRRPSGRGTARSRR